MILMEYSILSCLRSEASILPDKLNSRVYILRSSRSNVDEAAAPSKMSTLITKYARKLDGVLNFWTLNRIKDSRQENGQEGQHVQSWSAGLLHERLYAVAIGKSEVFQKFSNSLWAVSTQTKFDVLSIHSRTQHWRQHYGAPRWAERRYLWRGAEYGDCLRVEEILAGEAGGWGDREFDNTLEIGKPIMRSTWKWFCRTRTGLWLSSVLLSPATTLTLFTSRKTITSAN